MNTNPRRFRRGETSPDRPGLVFFRYRHDRGSSEIWLTPQRFESERQSKKRVQTKRRAKPEHKEKMKLYFRGYNQLPEQKAYHSQFYKQPHVRAKCRATHAQRMANDIQYKVAFICRGRMQSALRHRGVRKTTRTTVMLGCTVQFFKGWLEGQFAEGMSWQNYGSDKGQWEVDHRVPIARFRLEIEEERNQAFHYTNCRPMWAIQNRTKNDFVEHNGKTIRARELRKIIPFKQAA